MVFVALHALAGTIALLTGCFAHRNHALFATYLWSLAACVASLAAAMAGEWPQLDNPARAVFGAFLALALLMLWLAFDARRLPAPSPAYVDRVGFTLVALFDAFVVITVLNAGVPLAITSGVVVAVAGHFVLRAAKARLRSVERGTLRTERTRIP